MAFKFNKFKNFMKENGYVTEIVEFDYNNNLFTMLFQVLDKDRRKFVFFKRGSNENLDIDTNKNFEIEIPLNENKYREVTLFFEIEYNLENKFKPFNLFKYIDDNFVGVDTNNYDRKMLADAYYLENPNAIYYDGLIDWRNKNTKHVTESNRAKTQRLLPELFSIICNEDISVRYTENEKNKDEEINEIKSDIKNKNYF